MTVREYKVYRIDLRGMVTEVDSRIRPAKLEDIPQLREIATDSFTNSRHPREAYAEGIEKSVNDSEHAVFVYNGDSISGFVDLSGRKINLIAVKESVRGRGIGKKLMNAAADYLKRKGFDELFAETEADNSESNLLYGSLGATVSRTLFKPMTK